MLQVKGEIMKQQFNWLCLLFALIAAGASSEYLGITEPGTTDYSDWYGRIVDSVALDYDAYPQDVVYNANRNTLMVTFAIPTMPFVKEISLEDYSISEPMTLHFNAGRLVKTIDRPEHGTQFFICEKNAETIVYDCDGFTKNVRSSFTLDRRATQIERVFLPDEHLVYVNDDNGLVLRKRSLQTGEETELDMSLIADGCCDINVDDQNDQVVVVTTDTPGSLFKIDLVFMNLTAAGYLPSDNTAKAATLSKSSDRLFIVSQRQSDLRYSIVGFEMDGLTILGYEQLEINEGPIRIAGVTDSRVTLFDNGASPAILDYDFLLNRLQRVEITGINPPSSALYMYDENLLILDDHNPAKGSVYSLDNWQLMTEFEFDSPVAGVNQMDISPRHSKLIASTNESSPAKIALLPTELFSGYEVVEFLHGENTSMSNVVVADQRDIALLTTSGDRSAVVVLNLSTNTVDHIVDLTDHGFATDIALDYEQEYAYITTYTDLVKLDLLSYSIVDSLSFTFPDSGLTFCAVNQPQDTLIIGNHFGRLITCANSPLSKIAELSLLHSDETVSAGLVINEIGRCILCTQKNGGNATVYSIELEGFSIASSEQLGFAEYIASNVEYCPEKGVIKVGVHTAASKLVYLNPITLERLGEGCAAVSTRYILDGVSDHSVGKTYWCNRLLVSQITSETSTRAYSLFASRYSLDSPARLTGMNLHSRLADGDVRLAIYNDSLECIWQSETLANMVTNDWLSCDISAGIPQELNLYPGDYWLAFQTNSLLDVPSVHSGEEGQGLRQSMPFGDFPDKLFFTEDTSDQYAINVHWDHMFPTSTPTVTPTPSPTVSPTSTMIPTYTPTPSPTETPAPSPTVSPSPTPTCQPGVQLVLNKSVFKPGDPFLLNARVVPDPDTPESLILWVALDVYGEFWFGPTWQQVPDSYPMGEMHAPHLERILDFVWPVSTGSAEELKFWGAVTDESATDLIGTYDVVEFGFAS